ncbi:hypothetical protein MNBD_UNCLBAC01-1152 [hydrothermal vent metagenome]|uniref:DUF2059 domain-containing protein n=1 Tax=hydrothermal vent metagenome TaxID=652676 RepID=A0A3B1DAU8_9ZZZZ
MIKRICLCLIMSVVLSVSAFADTIFLKDGSVIEGEIISRTALFVVMRDERGVPSKYHMEQIGHIYGKEEQAAANALLIDPLEIEGVEEEKVRLIVEFIEVSGVHQNMQASIQQIIDNAPEERRWDLEELFDINMLVQNLIPIYDAYYTEEDLKALVAFYTSPVGQKFFEVTPKIMAEAMQVSVQYFQEKIKQN